MRPDIDRYFIDMARLVSSRSTCIRRHVGCVLVDAKNRVLATGYNGVPSGALHCNEVAKRVVGQSIFPNACAGADASSGERLDECLAVHAEQNAILQCRDTGRIARAYVTTFPCASCAKLLLNTNCEEIVCDTQYTNEAGWGIWISMGRLARHFDGEPPMIQRDIVLLYGVGDPLNRWRVVVACVCLNLCSARTARGVVMRILDRWPDPASLGGAGRDLEALLKPLGMSNMRAERLRALSVAWGVKPWGVKPLTALPGVGPYALESLAVFCDGEAPAEIVDRKVATWVAWRQAQGLELM